MAEDDAGNTQLFFEPERQESFTRTHSDEKGTPRSELWRSAVTDFQQLLISPECEWVRLGPDILQANNIGSFEGTGNVSGEVTDICIDARDAAGNTLYVATNNGGVWKTTDGGQNWSSTMDLKQSLSMGAVAIDPDDSSIVYSGTGNLFDGGHLFNSGVGLYKSIDAGRTWSVADGGLFATVLRGLGINRIVLPEHDVLLVGTSSGLYRSQDGGLNFGSNATGDDGKPILNGEITSLLVDPTPSITGPAIYAAIFGKGVFRSDDGARTFPYRVFDPGGDYGLIALAQSVQPDSNWLVAGVGASNPAGPFRGLFLSTDHGVSWSPLPGSITAYQNYRGGSLTGQTTYDLTVGIDPQNRQRIYFALEDMFISVPGATLAAMTFNAITNGNNQPNPVHADHHALVFSPSAHWGLLPPGTTRMYVGTDGGIYQTDNAGANWNALNNGLATSLFTDIDIGRGNPFRTFTCGAAQDTGTSVMLSPAVPAHPAVAPPAWRMVRGGDGGQLAVGRAVPPTVYGSATGRIVSGALGFGILGILVQTPQSELPPFNVNDPNTSVNLLLVDPGNNQIVYASVQERLFKSTNGGTTFIKVQAFSDEVTALSTTAQNSNLLWAGLANGEVHRSSNGGSDWDEVSPGVDGRVVESIAIDPGNASRIAVAYSGYSATNTAYRTRHVFLTTDNGSNWLDISGKDSASPADNLPDIPCLSVVIDTDGSIVVGTDAGVARCVTIDPTGATWKALGACANRLPGTFEGGFPRTACSSLALDETLGAAPSLLRVGTYGRGCFERTQPAAQRVAVLADLAFGAADIGQTAKREVKVLNLGGAQLTVSGFAPTAASNPDFQIVPAPTFPMTVNSHSAATPTFTVQFSPGVGSGTAEFVLQTDDPLDGNHSVFASGFSLGAVFSRLAARANLGFGRLVAGESRTLSFQLFNVGTSAAKITAIDRTDGSDNFKMDPPFTSEVDLAPGGSLALGMRFDAGFTLGFHSFRDRQATFAVRSNDSRSPLLLTATASSPANVVLTWIIVVAIGAAVVAGGIVGIPALENALKK